jgi:hypothetical protein
MWLMLVMVVLALKNALVLIVLLPTLVGVLQVLVVGRRMVMLFV